MDEKKSKLPKLIGDTDVKVVEVLTELSHVREKMMRMEHNEPDLTEHLNSAILWVDSAMRDLERGRK